MMMMKQDKSCAQKKTDVEKNMYTNIDLIEMYQPALDQFWNDIELYKMRSWSWEEFKWSKHTIECKAESDISIDNNPSSSNVIMEPLFPDLKISLVKEIINTGGRLDKSKVTLHDVHKGYLNPEQWHDMMQSQKFVNNNEDNAILIDCRNHKEYAIGHFEGAIDPNTKTFSEFFDWVDKQKKPDYYGRSFFDKKRVFMYCTGV